MLKIILSLILSTTWELGVFIFLISLFLIIIVGKAISKAVTWTGLGSIDKSFGLIFGVFKGYVVSVCLFSILNWFYPYQNWDISLNKSMSFEYIKKGSEVLIEEFPQNKDLEETKEKLKKFNEDKLRKLAVYLEYQNTKMRLLW